MKKNILLLVFLVFSTTSCWTDDDSGYFRSINLNVPNLIQIESQPNFNINDYIYFDVNFSRYLPEEGFTDLLDIYKTTDATKFSFSFTLYKKSAYNIYEPINFGDFYILEKGEIFSDHSSFGNAVYNSSNELYEFRAGIQLLETGEYKLEIDPYIYPNNSSNSNAINLSIFSINNQNDFTNVYEFQVN